MDLAHLFHIDLLRPVDHDLRHGIILQEWLDRTKPQDLITDIRYQTLHIAGDDRLDLLPRMPAVQDLLLLSGHVIDDTPVNSVFQLLVSLFVGVVRPAGKYSGLFFFLGAVTAAKTFQKFQSLHLPCRNK